jgi:hypothetical protein
MIDRFLLVDQLQKIWKIERVFLFLLVEKNTPTKMIVIFSINEEIRFLRYYYSINYSCILHFFLLYMYILMLVMIAIAYAWFCRFFFRIDWWSSDRHHVYTTNRYYFNRVSRLSYSLWMCVFIKAWFHLSSILYIHVYTNESSGLSF